METKSFSHRCQNGIIYMYICTLRKVTVPISLAIENQELKLSTRKVDHLRTQCRLVTIAIGAELLRETMTTIFSKSIKDSKCS